MLAGLLALGALGALGACSTSDAGDAPPAPGPATAGGATGPSSPAGRRIVALGEEYVLADLLALGIVPVASTATVADRGFLGLDGLDTDGIDALPATEPNLERLATYRPDLIVLLPYVIDAVGRGPLEAIAPLLVLPDDAQERMLALGEAFDRVDEARAELAALDTAIEAGRAELGAGRTVSVVTVYPGPSVAAWVGGSFDVPAMLAELGVAFSPTPDEVGDATNGRAYLSTEQLGLFDADTLIAMQSDAVEGEEDAFAEISTDPLWARLPAVEAGNVIEIDRLGYPGVVGRRRLVADLVAALAT
jgi:iron complex transport system substrate-binding protein